jgi:excisionase family DNA binding protein
MDLPGEYLTSKEAMNYLRVSRNTLLKLRGLGLPFIQLERKILYRKADLDSFMATLRIAPKAEKRRK